MRRLCCLKIIYVLGVERDVASGEDHYDTEEYRRDA